MRLAIPVSLLALALAASAQTTTRVSISSTGAQANGPTTAVTISESGRWIAMQSSATNLIAGDANGVADIFLHDRNWALTTRVSVTAGGFESNGPSALPSISGDGELIAFESSATNLVGGYGPISQIYVHDRVSGLTVAASSLVGNGASSLSALSLDGTWVVFQSNANNLVPSDTNGTSDIFIAEVGVGTTLRVSVNSVGVQGAGASTKPSISADGRYVTFVSSASNLVAGDTNGVADAFLHDTLTGMTTRVSTASAGAQANGATLGASISPDGGYVALASDASNLVLADTNAARDIFVKVLAGGLVVRASVSSGGAQANGNSFFPGISWDGREVSFHSLASNLAPGGDTNAARDVFKHDLDTGVTTLVSADPLGMAAGGTSWLADLDTGGRVVVFQSAAPDLVAGDTNGVSDAFVQLDPATRYIDVAGSAPGTGTPGDPFTSIQYAIQQPDTVSGDTLLVQPGTYLEGVDFLGKSLVLESTGGAAVTTIDASFTASAVRLDKGEGAGTTLRGLTLTNGDGTYHPASFSDVGGGLFCVGAALVVEACVVTGNGGPSVNLGGGAFCTGSDVQFLSTTIADNLCGGDGGGVLLEDCTGLLEECTVADNTGLYCNGGGVNVRGGTVAITNSTLAGNQAADGGHGGGLAQEGGSLLISGCLITENDVFNGHEGGGLYGESGTMTVTDTVITGNFSSYGGGVSAWSAHTMDLEGCLVEGNSSAPDGGFGRGHGGGVFARAGSSVSLELCTLVGNSAFGYFAGDGSGGGVSGAALLESCTLTLNTAVVGGGVCDSTLHNSIVWDNTPLNHCAGSTASWSDLNPALPGLGNISAAPLFWDPATGDFHLQPGSPCIDAGDPSSPLDPGGSVIDMGAFPFDPTHCPEVTSYCTAGTTANGCNALMGATGTPSAAAASGFDVSVTGVEGQKAGILFWGRAPKAAPWGAGSSYLCVQAPVTRTGNQLSGGTVGACDGTFGLDFNAWMQANPSKAPLVGETIYMQAWFRDPPSPKTTSLSDGLRFFVCP